MSHKSNTIKTILPVLFWAMAAGFWLPSGAEAADANGSIRAITPVGETINYQRQAGSTQAEDYFDVIGILNLNESDRVIIGDHELPLSRGAKIRGVSQYDTVGARLNEAGEAVIVDLISDEPN